MKRTIPLVMAISALILIAGCRPRVSQSNSGTEASGTTASLTSDNVAPSDATPDPKNEVKFDTSDPEKIDYAEKEEIRRSYAVTPETEINLRGINGGIKIETADVATAEVLIIRSANKREDLQFRKVMIERSPKELTIRVENDRKSIFSSLGTIPEGRQRVLLRLPKKIELDVNGLNGNFTSGEILGSIDLNGVSGEVKIARAGASTDINGVNGNVYVTYAPLVGKKIEINGVNGNIDLQFEGEVNADVNSWGVNGNVDADLPNVTHDEKEPRRGRINARIGTGGTKIELHGINGNIRMAKADKAAPTPVAVGMK